MTEQTASPATGAKPGPVSARDAERAALAPDVAGHTPKMPPTPPVNYPRAIKGMWDLIGDKEDTTHVFTVVRNLNGTTLDGAFHRFVRSDVGERAIRDPLHLLRAMDDRDRLRALPEDTFGHAYARFMDREGLSTNGVQEAAVAAGTDYDALRRDYPYAYAFFWHQNLSHDLYHVLTRYGRDGLGEGAVLRFTHEHTRSRGIKFIARFAGLRFRIADPTIPAGAIMREAAKLGREAEDFVTADWAALLELPLDEVRRRLNVGTPHAYLSVPQAKLARIGATEATPLHEDAREEPLAA